MSMRLYEIANEYQFLLSELCDEETGAVNMTALSKLESLTAPLETKCINVVRVFKQIDAEREAIEKERKAMCEREKILKKQVDKLKEYLLSNMQLCEISEIKCPQFVIKVQKNPSSADIYDSESIPNEYKKIIVECDVQKIREDLKKGVAIPGARLIQANSLRIK